MPHRTGVKGLAELSVELLKGDSELGARTVEFDIGLAEIVDLTSTHM